MTGAATERPATIARWYGRAPARALWRVLASVVVLVVVGVIVGEQALRAGTAVLTPAPVLLALLLGAVWRALAATRWLVLARALGAPLTWRHALGEYFRSELVNQVVPGGVVGDVDRARRHGRAVGLLPAARAVFLERTVGQLTLVAATVVTVLVRPELLTVQTGVDRRTVAVVSVVLVVVAGVALALWQPWRGRTGPLPVRALAVAVVLSIGVLACFVALFVLAARATGTDAATAPLPLLVPAVLVVLLLSGIPLTVAGWGAREAGAALCFAAVGLAAADGVAAAVGYGLLSLVSALPGLVPLLRPHAPPGAQVPPDPHGSAGSAPGDVPAERPAQVEVEADVVAEHERP